MRLSDYLRSELILPDLKAATKAEVLAELAAPLAGSHPQLDRGRVLQVLRERENLGTTGIGDGVAIPHGKLDGLSGIILVVGRSPAGVDFEALDGKPSRIFFMVLAPEQAAGMHLRILAHISKLLRDEGFRRSFLDAAGQQELHRLLKNA